MNIKKTDLRKIKWEIGNDAAGIRNRYYHAVLNQNGYKNYLKLSYYNEKEERFTGHECLNEVVVSRFLDLLGIEHVKYEPVFADISLFDKEYEVLLCVSKDYLKSNEKRIRIDDFYKQNKLDSETPLEFCVRYGFDDYIYQMIIIDYLIMNRDRYANNLEILIDDDNHIRFAPFFDHGLSLLCNSRGDKEMQAFDVLKDEVSLMYFGTWSVTKNLELIPKEKIKAYLSFIELDFSRLFDGIEDFLSPIHRQKILEILCKRMEILRNKGFY